MSLSISQLLQDQVRGIVRNSFTITIGKGDSAEEHTFYAKPICPVDMQIIARRHGSDIEQRITMAAMCSLLVLKVEREDGTKVFKQSDYESLVKLPVDQFVSPLFVGLFGDSFTATDDDEKHEERLGNSGKTTS